MDRVRGIRERGTGKMTQISWPEILKLGNFHQLRWEDQEFVGISFSSPYAKEMFCKQLISTLVLGSYFPSI